MIRNFLGVKLVGNKGGESKVCGESIIWGNKKLIF